jgi:hypothetical protein
MLTILRRMPASLRFPALVLVLLGTLLSSNPCGASLTGVLKLKVARCSNGAWLSGAQVDLVVYRPGYGQVTSTGGTTNSNGYVEFTVNGLEEDDEAHVTVTPSGESADDGHNYQWTLESGGMAGFWDLGLQGDSPCEDEWYDEKTRVVLCNYE